MLDLFKNPLPGKGGQSIFYQAKIDIGLFAGGGDLPDKGIHKVCLKRSLIRRHRRVHILKTGHLYQFDKIGSIPAAEKLLHPGQRCGHDPAAAAFCGLLNALLAY